LVKYKENIEVIEVRKNNYKCIIFTHRTSLLSNFK